MMAEAQKKQHLSLDIYQRLQKIKGMEIVSVTTLIPFFIDSWIKSTVSYFPNPSIPEQRKEPTKLVYFSG